MKYAICLVVGLLVCGAVNASQTVTTNIVGTDSLCSSYTSSATGTTVTLTCIPISPGAPTGCTPTINSGSNLNLPNTGGNANLAVTCATPGSGITYNWSRNGTFGASTAASWTDTPAQNSLLGPNALPTTRTTNYQTRACVGTACVTVPGSPLTAVVAAAGGAWGGTCAGFDTTHIVDLNWATPVRQYATGVGANDIIVVRFTTGNVGTSNNLPHVTVVEYSAGPYSRTAYLSATPCAFTNSFGAPGAGPMIGNTITSLFAITPGFGFNYYPVTQKNTTYYVNIRNTAGNGCTVNCDVSADLIKPGGL